MEKNIEINSIFTNTNKITPLHHYRGHWFCGIKIELIDIEGSRRFIDSVPVIEYKSGTV